MKKNIFKWLYIFVMAVVCVGFASCGDDDEKSVPPSVQNTNDGETDGDEETDDGSNEDNDQSHDNTDEGEDSDDSETPNFYSGKKFKHEWVKVANNHLCSYNIYFLNNTEVKVTSVGEGVLVSEKTGTYKIKDDGEIVFSVGKVVISPWRVKLLSAKYIKEDNQLYVESKDERIYDYKLKTGYRHFAFDGTFTTDK